MPIVVIKSTYSHKSSSRKGKKIWECEDHYPLDKDKDLHPSKIKLVLVDNYEGFYAPCVKTCQGELHEEVLQSIDYLKDAQSYCTLVLDMVPDSNLRSAFILMNEHVSATLALEQSANCATGAAKLTLSQPPSGVPGSSGFTQPAKRKRRFSGSTLTSAQAEGLVAGPPVETPQVNPQPSNQIFLAWNKPQEVNQPLLMDEVKVKKFMNQGRVNVLGILRNQIQLFWVVSTPYENRSILRINYNVMGFFSYIEVNYQLTSI